MKKLLFMLLILFTGSVMSSSLPTCPNGISSTRLHNCSGKIFIDCGEKTPGSISYCDFFGGSHTYFGDFKIGKKHGKGIQTYTHGDTYVGEFKYNQKHGQGTYTWAYGSKYVGEYKDDNRHGQGTHTWANGSKYVGGFKDDKMHGQGTLTLADGSIKKGFWEEGAYFGTKAEWDDIREKNKHEKRILAKKLEERLARERETEKKYNTIYNSCLLDKSKEVDMQVSAISEAVYKTCKDIATNPSWYENFKYNK